VATEGKVERQKFGGQWFFRFSVEAQCHCGTVITMCNAGILTIRKILEPQKQKRGKHV
jgi:hypothetical protein